MAVCTEISEVQQLFQELMEFADWRELGRELHVSEGAIQEIEIDYQKTAERRTALLLKWFDRQTRACWESIIHALRAIRQDNRAGKIANKYLVTQ